MISDRIIKEDISSHARYSEESLVIEIPESLNALEALSFRQALKPIFESEIPPSGFTLDFSRTSFIDSSGIGALASIIKCSKISGINLSTSGVSPQVYSVLKMTKLDQLLSIGASEVTRPETAA